VHFVQVYYEAWFVAAGNRLPVRLWATCPDPVQCASNPSHTDRRNPQYDEPNVSVDGSSLSQQRSSIGDYTTTGEVKFICAGNANLYSPASGWLQDGTSTFHPAGELPYWDNYIPSQQGVPPQWRFKSGASTFRTCSNHWSCMHAQESSSTAFLQNQPALGNPSAGLPAVSGPEPSRLPRSPFE
jgi:hypothetical protein